MSEVKIVHDVPVFGDWDEFIIVEAKTGIYWTSQVGGGGCIHPIVEGYILPFKVFHDENEEPFDDCAYLCYASVVLDDEEEMKKGIIALFDSFKETGNKYLARGYRDSFSNVILDENRKTELMEAWWPVKGYLDCQDEKLKDYKKEFIGYLVRFNCD